VNGDLTGARLTLINDENLLHQIEDYRSRGKSLLEIGYIAGHGAVGSLRQQLSSLSRTRTHCRNATLEQHPKMIEVNGKIAVTTDLLNKEISMAIADLQTRLAEENRDVAFPPVRIRPAGEGGAFPALLVGRVRLP